MIFYRAIALIHAVEATPMAMGTGQLGSRPIGSGLAPSGLAAPQTTKTNAGAAIPPTTTIGIIDAGSTGTRLHLFTFQASKIKGHVAFEENKPIHRLKEPEMGQTLNRLIHKAYLPEDTPLAFYATAGMRSLNELSQKEILADVRRILKKHRLIDSKVISGSEEGLYLLKGIEYAAEGMDNFYAVDMGGESIQVIIKNHNHIEILSLGLGTSSADSDALAGGCRHDDYGCIEKKIKEKIVKEAAIKRVPTNIILLSAFHTILKPYGSHIKIDDIKRLYNQRCGANIGKECSKLYFVISILQSLSIPESSLMNVLKYIKGHNLSWVVGKALEMNEKLYPSSNLNSGSPFFDAFSNSNSFLLG